MIKRKRFLARTFYWRFLASYLLISLIPFCAIIFTYFSTKNAIEDEIIKASSNSLYQFFNVVDTQVSEMSDINFAVLNTEVTQQRAYRSLDESSVPLYETYELQKYLLNFKNSRFDDVFVNFHRLDQIVGMKSGLGSRFFYEAFYKNRLSYQEFAGMMNANSENYVPRLVSMGSDKSSAMLAVRLSANQSHIFGPPDVTSYVVFNQERLYQLYKSVNFHNDSIIMIFGADNELLASSKPMEARIDLSSYNGSDTLYYDTFNGEKYVLQIFRSNVVDATYVSAIPTRVFWEKLNTQRTVTVISMALCAMISIIVASSLAKRNYNPITSLLNTIVDNTKPEHHWRELYRNEIEYIESVLQNSLEKNNILSTRMKAGVDKLRHSFLLRAIQGTATKEDNGDDVFSANNITLLSNSFGLILFRIEEVDEKVVGAANDSKQPYMKMFIMSNIVEELCAVAQHQGFVVNLTPDMYACLVNFTANEKQDREYELFSIAQNCTNYLKQYFRISCTVAISQTHSGLTGIRETYEETVQAMKYRFSLGKESIILYRDIADKKFAYNSDADSKIGKLLLQYITDDRGELHKDGYAMVQRILESSFDSEEVSLETIVCFKYDIINSIKKIMLQIDAAHLDSEIRFIHGMLNAETFDDFRAILVQALYTLREHQKKKQEKHSICDAAEIYVLENYMDPNVNNSTIADELHISRSYLAKLFKDQKGIALLDYLYKVRIENAKRLLLGSSLTVEDIAIQTGFLGSSALIKTFKKYEGITPGVFRKLQS